MNDFLSKVDLLNETVKDICEDKATPAQIKRAEEQLGVFTQVKGMRHCLSLLYLLFHTFFCIKLVSLYVGVSLSITKLSNSFF